MTTTKKEINATNSQLLYEVIKVKKEEKNGKFEESHDMQTGNMYLVIYDSAQEKIIDIRYGHMGVVYDLEELMCEGENANAKKWSDIFTSTSDLEQKYQDLTGVFGTYAIVADNNGIYWTRMDDLTKKYFNLAFSEV